MTTIVEKIINPINDWYQSSGVRAFWDWWRDALLAWVPETKRQQIFPKQEKLLITGTGEDVQLWLNSDQGASTLASDETVVDKQWWHQLSHHVAQTDVDSHVSYLLSEQDVLIREVAMPTAALSNIDAVLKYELDKYIPFNPQDVVFASRPLASEEGAEKTPVQLVVAQKVLIESIEKDASTKGVQLSAIDVNVGDEGAPDVLGVNLLSAELRKKKDWSKIKLNVALLFLVGIMVWFVMFNSLENKKEKIERIEAQTDEWRNDARRAKLLETELNDSIQAANFLGNKKTHASSTLGVLNELTRKIPQNSYLTRIILDEDKLEIVGQSDNANALVPILNESSLWFEPQIVGQVMPDARTGKEKFTIKAALKAPEEIADEA